jgi:hypothetical protein
MAYLTKFNFDSFNKSYGKEGDWVSLQRSVILYELILNYVLSSMVIFLLYLLNEKRKLRKK